MEIIAGSSKQKRGVLVIHSFWGLTPSFTEFGRQLAGEGLTVGLVDLFDGMTAQNETEARKLRQAKRKTPMYKTLGAGIEKLRETLAEPQQPIGVVGFSMGGHWAVWLSQRPEYNVDCTVLYYAARAGDFGQSRSRYLAHYAEDDPWVSPSARRTMERSMVRAGCSYRAYDYPGTGHWFAESDRQDAFDPDASALAFGRTARFLSSGEPV
jgi:carboxymethylenebutenolidase